MENGTNDIAPEPETGKEAPGAGPTRAGVGSGCWLSECPWRSDLFDGLVDSERKRTGLPAGRTPIDFLGKALWVTFAVVVLSGIGLMAAYRPTVAGSFQSVEYIQSSFPAGWWLRGIHKYGCDLFVMLAIVRLVRIAYRRAYKPPGQVTWIAALGVLAIGMISGLTGYLLVGGLGLDEWLSRLIPGGNEISQTFLSIAYTLHIALSVILLLFALRWRNLPRIQSPRFRAFIPEIPSGMIWTIVAVLSILALLLPPPLGSSIDRILIPHPILADWYFLPLSQVIRAISPGAGVFLFVVVAVGALILPWLDMSRSRGPRPAISALVSAVLLAFLLLTISRLAGSSSAAIVMGIIAVVWLLAFAVGILDVTRKPEADSEEPETEVSAE